MEKKTKKTSIKKKSLISKKIFPLGKFLNPEDLVSKLAIKKGMTIADLGAGTGHFAFPIAKKIGDEGTLFAVDIVTEKLEAIDSQAKILGISNITTQRGNLQNAKGSGMKDEQADWAVIVNVLFQNNDKKPIVSETLRILKKGGKALVLDWGEKKFSIGPDLDIRIDKKETEKMFEKQGFILEKEISAGDFHYGFIFKKPLN